jgi:hypothetical protein
MHNVSTEDLMRKIVMAAVAALSFGALAPAAEAMPLAPSSGLLPAAGQLSPIEKAQVYVYGGRRFCWYYDGWSGPGWYWCGYAWRRGYGWGGPFGWRGWRWHAWRPGYRPGGHWRYGSRSVRGDRPRAEAAGPLVAVAAAVDAAADVAKLEQ